MFCVPLDSSNKAIIKSPLTNNLDENGGTVDPSDDVKRELSYYLANGKLIKTQDIAYILGYSEPSAYLHAVKRWETRVGV